VCFSAWQEILNEKTKPVLHEASPAEFEEIAKETRDNQSQKDDVFVEELLFQRH
jgi:hypothetical protein